MATNFPTSLDALTNPTSSDSLSSPSHSAQHANVNDAVEALQVKVGIDSSADTSSHDYLIADLVSRITALEAAGSPMKKVAAFTSSGTWTVPTGVTYAIAHILGGGGGGGARDYLGTDGGTSSVAFASGTVSAGGGAYAPQTGSQGPLTGVSDSPVNSGIGGMSNAGGGGGNDGALIVAGDTVTPGASIAVTVGAGGAKGTSAIGRHGGDGGSGYVWIEYQETA